jgi:hypothetical protein
LCLLPLSKRKAAATTWHARKSLNSLKWVENAAGDVVFDR